MWFWDRCPISSQLFSGFSFYFDGFLGETTRLELVELVQTNGGDVEHFYSSSRVGIIIAKNVCYSKEQQYLKVSHNLPSSFVETVSPCSRSSVDFGFNRKQLVATILQVLHYSRQEIVHWPLYQIQRKQNERVDFIIVLFVPSNYSDELIRKFHIQFLIQW